jgi:hypothetical protein
MERAMNHSGLQPASCSYDLATLSACHRRAALTAPSEPTGFAALALATLR